MQLDDVKEDLKFQEKQLIKYAQDPKKLKSLEPGAIEMRMSVKSIETAIDKLDRFRNAMQSEMQDKLKEAYKTLEAAPDDSEAFVQYSFGTDNTDFKPCFEQIITLLNEEKQKNAVLTL